MPSRPSAGFIGIGTMGLPMARHLLDHLGALEVYDIDPAARTALTGQGARQAESIAALASACQIVFLSLPGPAEVLEVMDSAAGCLASVHAGTLFVDLSTNDLASVRALGARCAAADCQYLDAPVSGGALGAVRGKLATMVGGDERAFALAKPLLETFSRSVFHLGAIGAGTVAKLANNQIFLAAGVLIQESFVMAAKAGLSANQLLEILAASSAGMYTRGANLLLDRQFDNAYFKLAIAEKDLSVAVASAAALDVALPVTSAALAVYRDALDMGLGEEVFAATIKVLEARAQTRVEAVQRPAT